MRDYEYVTYSVIIGNDKYQFRQTFSYPVNMGWKIIYNKEETNPSIINKIQEGLNITDYKIKKNNIQDILVLSLKYVGKENVITGLKRISKPGLRVYVKAEEVPSVLNGLGIAVISTSKGVMTDKEARTNSLGGEVLAYIW